MFELHLVHLSEETRLGDLCANLHIRAKRRWSYLFDFVVCKYSISSIHLSPFSPLFLSPLNLPLYNFIYSILITRSNSKLGHVHFASSYLLANPLSLPIVDDDLLSINTHSLA